MEFYIKKYTASLQRLESPINRKNQLGKINKDPINSHC